jgi:hypothetical protein
MLYQPTCVGLRYGRAVASLDAFLGSSASIRPLWGEPRHFHSALGQRPHGFAYGDSLPPWRVLPPPDLALCVTPSLKRRRAGRESLTRCPSPTPSGLGLGPPHPQLISIAAEPSGIRWGRFSLPSRYSCQHSHSWPLQVCSRAPFSADHDAPLPRHLK